MPWRAALALALVAAQAGTAAANAPLAAQPRRLEYRIAWNGIPAASASVAITSGEVGGRESVDVQATARTNAFVDLFWTDRWSSAAGYSMVKIWNSDAQTPDAFRMGHYALANLLCKPTPASMAGVELQWGRRDNFSDGWDVNDFKVQFSFRYNFSYLWGGKS